MDRDTTWQGRFKLQLRRVLFFDILHVIKVHGDKCGLRIQDCGVTPK